MNSWSVERSRQVRLRGMIAMLAGPFILLTLSTRADSALVYDAANSTATIAYFRDATDLAPDAAVGAFGAAWLNPNFLFLGPNVDFVGLSWNEYYAAVTHSVVPTFFGQAVSINVPLTTRFLQSDGVAAIPESELRIDFNVELVAGAGGGVLDSLPGFYSLAFNVPLGSTGEFHARVFYDNVTTAQLNILPAQAMDFVPAPGTSGVVNLSFPGSGFVAVAEADRVRVSGFLEFFVNNDGGPVSFEIIPEPASLGLLLLGAIGLLRTRRRQPRRV